MERSKSAVRAKKRIGWMLFLLLLMTGIGILAGSSSISAADFRDLFSGRPLTAAGRIILYVRLPRVAGAIVAGAALAVAGAVIQTVLNNPLAGPNIIGVNSGAGFAAVLCGILLPNSWAALPAAAFAGAFVTVLFVFYLGKKTGSSKITLVLAGVAVNSILYGAIDAVNTFSEESLVAANAFKIGGLNGINVNVLKTACIPVILAILVLLLLHNELELLSLGEETAKTLGLKVSLYRFLFLMLAAVLAGAAVSFAGLLGFVGLIVPHVARLLVGEESKYLLSASAVLGALFLLLCDTVARTCFAPFELPVGILLSFVGAPFFLWLLFRRKRRNHSA